MKKTANKFLALIILIALVFSAFSFDCIAETVNKLSISVAVTETEEDGCLNVDLFLNENPGVGAMTFALMYDRNFFSTADTLEGYFYEVSGLSNYMVVDHSDNGYISFVWANQKGKLYKSNSKFLTLSFRMNKKVPGKHWFKIANINPSLHGEDLDGCFANFNNEKFVSTAINGFYVIFGDKNNPCVSHSFELYQKLEPSCIESGYSLYLCPICSIIEKKEVVSALGHDFESEYTVDREASKGITKIISRHCSRCDERTDIKYISSNAPVKSGDKITTEELSKLPIVKEENNKNEQKTVNDTSDNSGTKNKTEKSNNVLSAFSIDSKVEQSNEEENVVSAEKLIDKIKNKNIISIGGFDLPKKAKTIGDYVAKAWVYLFGVGDKPGLFSMIFGLLIDLFA